jgi:hypothetical protein
MTKKINRNVFDDVRESLEDVLAFEQGRSAGLCSAKLQARRQQDILSLFGKIDYEERHDHKRERHSKRA